MLRSIQIALPAVAVLMVVIPTPARADASSEADALVHIHDILTLADHDYDGHRIKAMHAVEAACNEMRIDPHGDHHNLPGQRNSDDLMHEADRELQDVRRVADDKRQGRVVGDVDDALHEIHIALHIR